MAHQVGGALVDGAGGLQGADVVDCVSEYSKKSESESEFPASTGNTVYDREERTCDGYGGGGGGGGGCRFPCFPRAEASPDAGEDGEDGEDAGVGYKDA